MLKFSAIVLLVFHVLLVSSQGTAGNTSGGNTFKVTFYPGKINCTGAGVVEQTLSFPSSYPACIPYPSSATLRTVSPFPAAHIRVKSCSGSRVKADWMCDEGCSSCILAASLKSDMCHIESDLSSMWFNDVSCGSGGDGDSTIVIVLGVSGGIIGVSVAVCFAVWMRRRDKQNTGTRYLSRSIGKRHCQQAIASGTIARRRTRRRTRRSGTIAKSEIAGDTRPRLHEHKTSSHGK